MSRGTIPDASCGHHREVPAWLTACIESAGMSVDGTDPWVCTLAAMAANRCRKGMSIAVALDDASATKLKTDDAAPLSDDVRAQLVRKLVDARQGIEYMMGPGRTLLPLWKPRHHTGPPIGSGRWLCVVFDYAHRASG